MQIVASRENFLNFKIITKCVTVISKCYNYYKVRRNNNLDVLALDTHYRQSGA